VTGLFVQFSGHVYTVTGKRLGNFVGRRARFLSLSGDFCFCTINGRGSCRDRLSSERTKEADRAITATKVLMLFMI
jgi:hypothetical protein